MKKIYLFSIILFLFTCESMKGQTLVELKLPVLFCDHMVIQRDQKINIWGTASIGEKITVRLANQIKTTTALKDQTWKVELQSLPAGGPYELIISGSKTIIFHNVMLGDVWVCSGQSNMEMPIAGWGKINHYEKEIANADFPNIRLFTVEKIFSNHPEKDVKSTGWKICNPSTIPEFSAVAYFFGKEIQQTTQIPIGLINTSWGGTVAEAWTSKEGLKQFPDFLEIIKKYTKLSYEDFELATIFKNDLAAWEKSLQEKKIMQVQEWYKDDLIFSDWKTMKLPSVWEKSGIPDFDGIVWFKKIIEIPDSWQGKDLVLNLGPIDDMDQTYFNGKEVGFNFIWDKPRQYTIPAALVKKGKNIITVKVIDTFAAGGIWGTEESMEVRVKDEPPISIAGNWLYKIGLQFKDDIYPPTRPAYQNTPTFLYNAMIAPLQSFHIKGVIWYQGESNVERAYQYQTLFPALINDWRTKWNIGNFPFLFVQLANFMPSKPEPADDPWAELREAQRKTLSVPNTGMAVTIDIGDAFDIHPKNKQDVGHRLALNAKKIAYALPVENSGPVYQGMTIKKNKIKLDFNHADSLNTNGGEKLTGFAIAEQDHVFYWADAVIENNSVIVSSEKILEPVAVRYAWSSNPVCNLYNKHHLPASPFRTDNWKGITEGRK